MSVDIALIWNDAIFAADIAMANGDLVAENGLRTAVIISLATDREAEADDEIPDGSTDRRGWWGDMGCSADPPGWNGDKIGSRLWLLARAKAIPETALRAKGYVAEALQWLIDDGIALAVDVSAVWINRTALGIRALLTQNGANQVFDLVWEQTTGVVRSANDNERLQAVA
jgi:phage gp46-like protein